MTERGLEEAVAACRLPPPRAFPRDLATDVLVRLPVTLVPMRHLTSAQVRDWLARHGLSHEVTAAPRSFHGCMVARAGKGILFYDSVDGEREQRFTLAHEVSHFVLDHLLPRDRALRAFGECIREVLDERRPPTPEELLSSVLDGVSLGVQVKLMDRDASGAIHTGGVARAEWRADRLALELLAPAPLALETLSAAPGELGEAQLAFRFGLPLHVARQYARLLRSRRAPRFSIAEFLGEDGR